MERTKEQSGLIKIILIPLVAATALSIGAGIALAYNKYHSIMPRESDSHRILYYQQDAR